MSKLIEETKEKFKFKGDGETWELTVESHEREGDYYVRDFTEDDKLINKIESQESILTYTESIYDIIDEYQDTLNELNLTKDDVDEEGCFVSLLYSLDESEVFAVIEQYYLKDINGNNGLPFKCKTTSLLK